MSSDVIIAGVGMIPFKKPGQSESYDVMGARAAKQALDDADIDYRKVQQAYASYVYGDSCSGQAALYHLGITGIPIVNVNNNCASGSSAFQLAAQLIRAGALDCVLAVGFEQMQPGALDVLFPGRPSPIARHVNAAADLLGLDEHERELPPAIQLFGCQAELLKTRYGVSEQALVKIAAKARRHAQHNPYAIFKTPIDEAALMAEPAIFRGLKKLYACPPSCGAAAVILCSEKFAKANNITRMVKLIGSGWGSDKAEYFQGDPLDVMFRALSKDAATQAYNEAGIAPEDVDVIELHDCFTSNEILTYAALGLCDESEFDKFVLEQQNTYGGKYVVGPSGGLLAKGHPLGATGLAQITELVWQLTGRADKRQVDGARTGLQHNGGLGSAGFVHILQAV